MDVLEILVLLIALVLIALVVSVVLVVVQAVVGKRKSAATANVAAAAPVVSAVRIEPVVTAATTEEPVVSDNINAKLADVSAQTGDNSASDHNSVEDIALSPESESVTTARAAAAENEIRRPAIDAAVQPAPSVSGERYPYMAGGPLLSPIERLFYGDLKASVSDRTEIFCKVRASDVINPKASLSFEEMQFASEQLATQRFDFVLCDSRDFSVVCVIELDGIGEREGLRKIQREILRKCAESANLPILLVDMKRGYTIKEIRDRVSYLLPAEAGNFVSDGGMSSIAELVIEIADDLPAEADERADERAADESVSDRHEAAKPSSDAAVSESSAQKQTLCPRCHSPLKLTLATTGEFAGGYFWICSKLPECPYVAPVTPPQ